MIFIVHTFRYTVNWRWYDECGTATRSGSTFTMTNWKNVAAYEVVDETGKKVCISDGLLAPSGTATFTMKTAWKDGFKVYAVSATGARTAVTF